MIALGHTQKRIDKQMGKGLELPVQAIPEQKNKNANGDGIADKQVS